MFSYDYSRWQTKKGSESRRTVENRKEVFKIITNVIIVIA